MADIAQAITETFKKDKVYGVQYLEQCLIKSKDKVRPHKHTELTFVTEEVNTNHVYNDGSKLGVIVWVDRETFVNEANK